jgi:hypothetical protein
VDTVLVPMRLRNVTRLMINVVLIARVMVFQEKHSITLHMILEIALYLRIYKIRSRKLLLFISNTTWQ